MINCVIRISYYFNLSCQMVEAQAHPFAHILQTHAIGDKSYKYFNMASLGDPRYDKLPYSIKVLLESAIRGCDNFNVKGKYTSE